jgi:hypothetical protein
VSPVVIDVGVEIKRSPEAVFDYCSDHTHEPEWNPIMRRIEKLTDGPIGVGTRYAIEFVKSPPMVMECTQFERPTGWSLGGESRALRARGEWHVEPTSEGAHLTMRTELELRGMLKLAAPLVLRQQRTIFERDVENIRARLERCQPAPGRSEKERLDADDESGGN